MGIELHLISNTGVDRGVLPSYESIEIAPVFCDYGTLKMTYPRAGKKFQLLDESDEFEVAVYIDGVIQPKLGGIMNEFDGDDVDESSVSTFSGKMYLAILDEAIVYPAGWPNYDVVSPNRRFTNSTAGTIMQTLIADAKARGAIQGVTTSSFSSTTDSKGQTWAKQISLAFRPGVKLSEILKNLYSNGLCEFEMVGRDLRLYNPDTLTVDRTLSSPPLTFRRGRDLRDSPRKRTGRDRNTVILGAGKEDSGIYHEQVDPDSISTFRRTEGFVSNGSITDKGTLQTYTQLEIQRTNKVRMEKTHGLEFVQKKSPRPIVNFDVGDWCFSDVGKGLERLRIKQWVLSINSAGAISGSVVLNDLFAEASERLAKRIDGILGGSTITGESKAEDYDPALTDGKPPAAPTGLEVASSAYTDGQGITYAQASASWLPVDRNADGTLLEDLAGYMLRWRYQVVGGEDDWRYVNALTDTFITWSPLVPSRNIDIEVAAYDRVANFSAWSDQAHITTGNDVTPPSAPSAPQVSNYLGLLRVYWNGRAVSNAIMAPDTRLIRVYMSNVNNFTAAPENLVGTMTGAGSLFFDRPYGEVNYVRFVAIDLSGNVSDASPIGSGSSSQVTNQDLIDGAIAAAKIADGAVTNTKLGLGAVTGLKIADFAVDTTKIADLAITGGKVAALAIGTTHITDGAIENAKIANAAITTAKIRDLSVSAAKIDKLAVGEAQIADLAVSSAKIALLAVNEAHIADLSVDNAKIKNLSVAKLTAGLMQAEVIIGGRFTTALNGARSEMTASGFQKYDAFENLLVNITGTETLVTGMYKSARMGRRVEMGVAGFWGSLNFYSDDGDTGFVRVATEGSTIKSENLQLGVNVPGGNVSWNLLGYSTNEQAAYRTGAHDFLFNNRFQIIQDEIGNRGVDLAKQKLRLRVSSDAFDLYAGGVGDATRFFNFSFFDSTTRIDFGNVGSVSFSKSPAQLGVSGTLQMRDVNNSGGLWRVISDNRGIVMETRNIFDQGFLAIRAAGFEVNSDARDKKDIEEIEDIDSMAMVKSLKPKRYIRKKQESPLAARQEIGLIAQEAPGQIVTGDEETGMSIDMYQLVTLLVMGQQQIMKEIDTLRKKVGGR